MTGGIRRFCVRAFPMATGPVIISAPKITPCFPAGIPPVYRLPVTRLGVASFSSASSSSPCSISASSGLGFVSWYLAMIKARPVITKSVTASLIYTIADLSSQALSKPSSECFDLIRTVRMMGYGMVVLGPSLHCWFNFVSRVLPLRDTVSTLKKIVMGQTLYGPVMTAVFFSLNAGFQGESGSEIMCRLRRDMVPTMINGVMYWPFCDFVTFRFCPVHLQPLLSNMFSYLWTIYMTYMASLGKA